MNYNTNRKLSFFAFILWTFFVTCKSIGMGMGPGIGGGGNITCGNVPISSVQQVIENPRTLPLLADGWFYIDKLNESLKDNSRQDLKRYLNYFLNSKKWFLYDCAFDNLPNSQLGTGAPSDQIIRHFPMEIHISKPLVQKLLKEVNGIESLRELLLREQFEALKLLSKDSSFNQCLSIAPEPWFCDGNSKSVKSNLELDGIDHSKVREISFLLISDFKNHSFSFEKFINSLISNDFDIYGGWLYGVLPYVYIGENTLVSWIKSWEQHEDLIKIRPELSSCHKIQIISFAKSDSTHGIYAIKLKYDEREFEFTLKPDYSDSLNKQNGINYKLTTYYEDNSGQSIVHYTASPWMKDFNLIKKIGIKYPSVRLLFDKEGTQIVPIGYEFEGHITTRIKDDGSVNGIVVESEVCNF